jgi:hypothetical protein
MNRPYFGRAASGEIGALQVIGDRSLKLAAEEPVPGEFDRVVRNKSMALIKPHLSSPDDNHKPSQTCPAFRTLSAISVTNRLCKNALLSRLENWRSSVVGGTGASLVI